MFTLYNPHGMCLGTDLLVWAQQVQTVQSGPCEKILLSSALFQNFSGLNFVAEAQLES